MDRLMSLLSEKGIHPELLMTILRYSKLEPGFSSLQSVRKWDFKFNEKGLGLGRVYRPLPADQTILKTLSPYKFPRIRSRF